MSDNWALNDSLDPTETLEDLGLLTELTISTLLSRNGALVVGFDAVSIFGDSLPFNKLFTICVPLPFTVLSTAIRKGWRIKERSVSLGDLFGRDIQGAEKVIIEAVGDATSLGGIEIRPRLKPVTLEDLSRYAVFLPSHQRVREMAIASLRWLFSLTPHYTGVEQINLAYAKKRAKKLDAISLNDVHLDIGLKRKLAEAGITFINRLYAALRDHERDGLFILKPGIFLDERERAEIIQAFEAILNDKEQNSSRF